NFDKRETKAIGVRQLMLRKPKGRNADFANPDTLNMIIIKGAYDSNVVVVVAVNGAWKRIRKKGFVISAVGWSICLEGRDIEDGGMRVETINAEQAEAKGLLQGIRRTIAHDVQYVTILTDCSNVIVALREFPCFHWDLSAADFEAGPEPIRGFYIVVLVNSRYALVLGDMEIDPALKDLVDGLVLPKVTLVSQCEHYKGQWNSEISSKAKFSEIGVEHEIMIKCWQEEDGPQSPVLSVYIDKKRVVRIKRLQWNFRGNQVIFVDGLLVDVMWDVYGWYFDQTVGGFNSNKGGCGFIMFRTRSGLDSRLWLEEEENKLSDQNLGKPEFSLLICATQ
ncbi:hypothetical protein SOVF_142720, partial [Spinacia oleracea]